MLRRMKLRLLLAPILVALAIPAAADARVVEVPRGVLSTEDPIAVDITPNRRPPRGWHLETSLLFDSEDEDGTGCAYYSNVTTHFGGRAFTVTFRPHRAELPTGGSSFWCSGEARVALFQVRNGAKNKRTKRNIRFVATSRTFIVDAPAEDDEDDYLY